MSQRDTLAPEQLRRFEAMVNRRPESVSKGDELTMCSHWAYFTPLHLQSDLTVQGYPRDQDLFPPIEQSSRLWLGGRLQFKNALTVGTPATRYSTITEFKKEGADQAKVYLSLQHQISTKGSIAIQEDQHFLYRQPSEKGAHPTRTEAMDIDPDWEKSTKPDSILLFRFSALTFNAHRIHYDQDYARNVEGYPNVMVHGPLLLLLALEAFRSTYDGKVLEDVEYELRGPVYLGEQIKISGKTSDNYQTELRITGHDNNIALKAKVKWTYEW
jgi:3-methylfumaryl-CoA hydratase